MTPTHQRDRESCDSAHLQKVVTSKEGPITESFGALGYSDEIGVGGPLLRLSEDAQIRDVHPSDTTLRPYEHRSLRPADSHGGARRVA